MDTYIGIDYGGTKLLIGETDESGILLNYRRYPTGRKNQEEAAGYLLCCLEDYMDKEKPEGQRKGVGIGIVGISHWDKGIWHSINHLPGKPVPLAAMVGEKLGLPGAVENDVRSGAAAELLWGWGKESSNFIYINVGTGLAAGIVIDGRIVRGANHNAGEVGHMVVDNSNEQTCICGRKGCAELRASGLGIHQNFMAKRKEYKTKLMMPENGDRVSGFDVFRLAGQGDPLCKTIMEEAARTLSCVIMNLVRVTDPDTVILGGGLAGSQAFIELASHYLDPVTMRGVVNGVVVSRFEPEFAGLIGAAAVGKLGKERVSNM